MANIYWDYENGSDGANGLSFANRKKTLASCITAAVAGDTVRCMASLAPTDTGQSATLTNKSQTVTLSSAVTLTITDCESAWTGSAGVTATADAAIFLEGTRSASLAIAAGYNFAVTPIVAFFNTGTLNLSSYRQITFRMRSTVAQAASVFALRLSTTVAGVTSTHQVTITRAMNAAQWFAVTLDTGGSMNAAIESVALIGLAAPTVGTIHMDNIEAAKDPSSADAITHSSLIGKNTAGETWWQVNTIKGTTITLGTTGNNNTSALSRGYSGTTASVTLYKRECIKTDFVATRDTLVHNFAKVSTEASPITVSGGWNRTDMSDQVGFDGTYFDGVDGFGVGINLTNVSDFGRVENFGLFRYATMFSANSSFSRWNNIHSGYRSPGGTISTFPGSGGGFGPTYVGNVSPVYLHNWGGGSFAHVLLIGDLSILSSQATSPTINITSPCRVTGTLTMNNNVSTSLLATAGISDMNKLVCKDSVIGFDIQDGVVRTKEFTSSGNTTSGVLQTASGRLIVSNATISDATPYSRFATADRNSDGNLTSMSEVSPSASPCIIRHAYGTLQQATDQLNTGGGSYSWKFSVTTALANTEFPFSWLMRSVYVQAGQTLTFNCAGRKDNAGITARIRIKGGTGDGYFGIASDQIDSVSGVNAWETLTLTVTPTITGVLEVWMEAFGGTTFNCWFDGPITRTIT